MSAAADCGAGVLCLHRSDSCYFILVTCPIAAIDEYSIKAAVTSAYTLVFESYTSVSESSRPLVRQSILYGPSSSADQQVACKPMNTAIVAPAMLHTLKYGRPVTYLTGLKVPVPHPGRAGSRPAQGAVPGAGRDTAQGVPSRPATAP